MLYWIIILKYLQESTSDGILFYYIQPTLIKASNV